MCSQISPTSDDGGGAPDPAMMVAPIAPAPQRQAKMQNAETPVGGLGSNIFEVHQTFVQHLGVPGIAEPTSMGGNRSLWFGLVGE